MKWSSKTTYTVIMNKGQKFTSFGVWLVKNGTQMMQVDMTLTSITTLDGTSQETIISTGLVSSLNNTNLNAGPTAALRDGSLNLPNGTHLISVC